METLFLFSITVFAFSSCKGIICPFNWKIFGESCYFLVDESMTFDMALSTCTEMGGALAVPESLSEHQFIWEMFTQDVTEGDLWIGCTDKEEEDKWVQPGEGGHECSYVNWYPGEPNAYPADDCASMKRSYDGRWNDHSCAVNLHIVCERPTTVAPATAMFYSHADDDGSGTLECLTGHVIKEFSIQSYIACGMACRNEPRCRSINLRLDSSGKKICQLNDITRNEAGEDEIILGNSCSLLSKSIN